MENVEAVVRALFPRPVETTVRIGVEVTDLGSVPRFSAEELALAVKRLVPGKAPGPDCVPNVAVRILADADPALMLQVYNRCLTDGVFPNKWKIQRLVLIPKGPSAAPGPSSYRPLCMLDGMGKVLEGLILQRLQKYLEDGERGLSAQQFGFRPGRSTLHAMQQVVDTVKQSWSGSVKTSSHTAVIALDIKNAFNTANWKHILEGLSKIGAPPYLIRIIDSYFDCRILRYGCRGKTKECTIRAGVPQGSVLGPALWNVMYDGLLRIPLMEGVKMVAFADDLALIVTSRTLETLRITCQDSVRRTRHWLIGKGLELAAHKTEAILFTRRRNVEPPQLVIGGYRIEFSKSIRYLGVQLDHKLTFVEHTERAAAKAARVAEELARLMPNIGGPKTSRRKLFNEVVHSTLLYGAPIWADAMRLERARSNLARVQRRSLLRVAAAYRTVSEDAILVLTASPPIDLLALERRAVHLGATRSDARERTMAAWQVRWSASSAGRWTHRLIGGLTAWCAKEHGQLCFHLTQALTGHGCFGSYLHRIGKEPSPKCHHCEAGNDDPCHTLFHCPGWSSRRDNLCAALGVRELLPEGMVPSMLGSPDAWAAWSRYVSAIMRAKEEAEHVRRGERSA